ncbi:putative bacterial Ig-like domain [Tenacibaculum amylolyticum]
MTLPDDNDISVVNVVAQPAGLSGRTIATHTADGTVTNIQETVTTFSQNDTPTATDPTATGEITYTDENGNDHTAQVVSANANNKIEVGTDGGAYFGGPTITAAAKVTMTYSGTFNSYVSHATAKQFNIASINRASEGVYNITFTDAMNDANYIIQLAIRDCGGNCPGNSNANYDDPGITYTNQTANGFTVIIKDSDNGTTAGDPIDLEFMFSIIDF